MIVVPKPNPLNINRLGNPSSHHYSSSSVHPATLLSNSSPSVHGSINRRIPNPPNNRQHSTPPRSPISYKHSSSNSSSTSSKMDSSFNPFLFYSPPPVYSHGASANNLKNRSTYHRHTNSSYTATTRFPGQFVVGNVIPGGTGPEFEMALDLSDMSPPLTPSPSPSPPTSPSKYAYSRTPSPVHTYHSFPSTPAPIPRPSHFRAPSAPLFNTHGVHAVSLPVSGSPEGDRYASSKWQNSPPAASLPKPKFLDNVDVDADVFN